MVDVIDVVRTEELVLTITEALHGEVGGKDSTLDGDESSVVCVTSRGPGPFPHCYLCMRIKSNSKIKKSILIAKR